MTQCWEFRIYRWRQLVWLVFFGIKSRKILFYPVSYLVTDETIESFPQIIAVSVVVLGFLCCRHKQQYEKCACSAHWELYCAGVNFLQSNQNFNVNCKLGISNTATAKWNIIVWKQQSKANQSCVIIYSKNVNTVSHIPSERVDYCSVVLSVRRREQEVLVCDH